MVILFGYILIIIVYYAKEQPQYKRYIYTIQIKR